MSARGVQDGLEPGWRDVLALSQALLRQSDLHTQRTLVVAAANKLIPGQADLWLDHAALRQPGVPAPPDSSAGPDSDLMRGALRARRIQFGAPAGGALAMAAPLRSDSLVFGALQVSRETGTPFTETEIALLELVANQAAVGLHVAHEMAIERWRSQAADSLREVVGLLSANPGLEELLDELLTKAERTLPCQAAAIWLVQENNLCMAAVRGAPADMCISHMASSSSWLYQALDAHMPMLRTRGSAREPVGIALNFGGGYSAIAAPLRISDRPPLGLLVLVHPDPGRYADEARDLVAAFASSAAVAIENTRLYRSAQEQAWISTVMLEIARSTQSLATLGEVIETVVRLVPMLAHVDRCAVVLWDDTAGAFVRAAADGLNPVELSIFNSLHIEPAGEPTFEHLRAAKTPLALERPPFDSGPFASAVASMGFDVPLLLPLVAQGELAGALLVDRQEQSDSNSVLPMGSIGHDEWMAVLQGIAYQTAAAIENAQLRQALQEDAYISTALLQVAQAIASLTDVNDILGTIVRITPTLVGVERCAVYLWEPETGDFQPAHAYGVWRSLESQFLAQRFAPGEFPLLDAAREQARPIRSVLEHTVTLTETAAETMLPSAFLSAFAGRPAPVGWPASEGPPAPAGLRPAGDRSFLAVPLLAQAEVIGVMVVEEAGQPHTSRQRWLEIISGIANQAAVAVQNGRLQTEMARRIRLEQELQLAREIQQSLMPQQLPAPPGWEIAAACRPARQVGGDFFDLFKLPDNRLGVVIADVADKGMPAALFMALTRALIRTIAVQEASPASVLTRVNELMVPDARSGMFVTAIYGALALDTGLLTYANAGHNLPLLVHPSTGRIERLSKGQIALGVTTEAQREDRRLLLGYGDCMVLYTDGVTEAFSEEQDEFYGEERLVQLVQASPADSAQRMLDRIIESVDTFVGRTPQSDDLTGVVIRRTENKTSGAA